MIARWKWIAGVLALSTSGAAGWWFVRRVPIEEVVELAIQGDERVLRKSLRPHGAGPRVLLFALDGVGENELQAVLEGELDLELERLLGPRRDNGVFQHGYAAPNVLGILPTTTIAAWSSIFTGQSPAQTGVPGNEWFAREELRFYAPVPVSVVGRSDTLAMLTDGLVGNAIKTPTLFDLADVRAYVSLGMVHRGADIFTSPAPSAIADLFVEVAKGWTDHNPNFEAYGEIDRESVDSLLSTLDRHGIPRLQVVYFPGIDLYTHLTENALEQQKRYFREVIDPLIGRVLKAYAAKGVLEDTYVLCVSDHGHTPVLHDDRHALSAEGDDEPPALIAGLGYRLRPFELEVESDDFQAVVAYQGAIAYLYLADRSTCPELGDRCDWKLPPRFEEDVMPLVRAFHEVNETGEPIAALRGTLDLVFAREPRPAGRESLPFEIFDGQRLVPIADYLRLNPRPDLLRLEERMSRLSAGPHGARAGDVLLLAKSGLERPIEDRFYFSHEYSSWHGSASAQDSRIPLLVASRAVGGDEIARRVQKAIGETPSQLDVVPLVLDLLQR